MAIARSANAVPLDFLPPSLVKSNLSEDTFSGNWLLGSPGAVDEECSLVGNVKWLSKAKDGRRAEAMCDLPPALAGGKPSWLVLYDAPGRDRRDGEHTVFGDQLRHN